MPDQSPAPAIYGPDAIDHAMQCWREGARRVTAAHLPQEWLDDYARAVFAVQLAALHQCRTLRDVLAVWYDTRPHRPMIGALRGATHDAAQHGRLLNHGLIEDAACWRRVCQIIRAHVDASESGQDAGHGASGQSDTGGTA